MMAGSSTTAPPPDSKEGVSRSMQDLDSKEAGDGKVLGKTASGSSGSEQKQRTSHQLMVNTANWKMVSDLQKEKRRQTKVSGAVGSKQFRVYSLVHHKRFTFVVSFFIVCNAAYIGLETDLAVLEEYKGSSVWGVIEFGFTTVFLLELILRFFAERLQFFFDKWNLFDFGLVTMACLDTFILSMIVSSDAMDVFAVMRIIRLFRLLRIVRLLRFFKELWLLVTGVLDAMRTLVWAWLLIGILIYVFGVFAVRMIGQPHRAANPEEACIGLEDDPRELICNGEYFATVPRAMFTFFQVMTTEGWSDAARASMWYEGWSWVMFMLFLGLTTFGIMNVVVAVIVENTLEQAVNQKSDQHKLKEAERHAACAKIYEVFLAADADGNGEVTKEEFLSALEREDVSANLAEVGIDARQAENLFDILDYDESGSLDAQEFIEGILKARGEAKSKDVLAVQCDVWRSEKKLKTELQDFNSKAEEEFELSESRMEEVLAALDRIQWQIGGVPVLDAHPNSQGAPSGKTSSGPIPPTTSGDLVWFPDGKEKKKER